MEENVNNIAEGDEGKAYAVISLVFGILSLLFVCCRYAGVFTAVTAIVFGIMSISRKERTKGIAIAGIICAATALLIAIGLVIAFQIFLGSSYYDEFVETIINI